MELNKSIFFDKHNVTTRDLETYLNEALSRGGGASTRDGVPQFPVSDQAGVVTLELVNRLRDEAP